nr:hypothetical protein [Tanacetum cinerariifolium]
MGLANMTWEGTSAHGGVYGNVTVRVRVHVLLWDDRATVAGILAGKVVLVVRLRAWVYGINTNDPCGLVNLTPSFVIKGIGKFAILVLLTLIIWQERPLNFESLTFEASLLDYFEEKLPVDLAFAADFQSCVDI